MSPSEVPQSGQLATLHWQFSLVWRLAADYQLPGLTDEACLWQPAPGSWTVRPGTDGLWRADFSAVEPDPPPTVTIGWISWQMIWWWSGALAALGDETPPAPGDVLWPGSAQAIVARLHELAEQWDAQLHALSDAELNTPFAFPWPEPQPLALFLAWANSELMKNVAEIGVIRHQFLAQRG